MSHPIIRMRKDIRAARGDEIGGPLCIGEGEDPIVTSRPYAVVVTGPEGDSHRAFMWERGVLLPKEGATKTEAILDGETEECMVTIIKPIKDNWESEEWQEWKRLWYGHIRINLEGQES